MAVTVPHFPFPVSLGADNHINTVEQDSEEDILSCVFVALRTTRGTRYYAPEFGIDDYTFVQAPVRVADIQAQITDSEPRADTSLDVEVQELIETVVVGVSNVG